MVFKSALESIGDPSIHRCCSMIFFFSSLAERAITAVPSQVLLNEVPIDPKSTFFLLDAAWVRSPGGASFSQLHKSDKQSRVDKPKLASNKQI